MSFPILGSPKQTFLDSSGNPLASGTLAVLEPSDDTNKASYPTADDADAATNANVNPVVLDARGEPPSGLFGVDDQKYKLVLKDSTETIIWTQDDVRVPTRSLTLEGSTAQTLTGAGAITLTESTTFLVTTSTDALTLADGSENQHKYIVMKTDGGVGTLTPTSFANGVTIVFDDAGDSAHLLFANASWHWLGGSATVTGNAEAAVTLGDNGTPTVGVGSTFLTTGTTAITDFDDGVVGQTIKILFASSKTITDGTPIQLRGSTNFDGVAGDTLTLHMFNDQVWEEIGRSTTATGTSSTAVLMTAGTGITTGSGTLYKASVARSGEVISTSLLLDLTGLRSTAADDIIGVDGTALDCHFGQITSAINGTILTGTITCLEVPAGGDPDINVYGNVESTGSESDDPSGLTGTGILVNTGDHTLGLVSVFAAIPAANEYLYLVAGAATDADYTAGKFLIELNGY